MYGYEWTNEYGIFRLTIDAKLQKEIRPVYHEELDFFGLDKFWVRTCLGIWYHHILCTPRKRVW